MRGERLWAWRHWQWCHITHCNRLKPLTHSAWKVQFLFSRSPFCSLSTRTLTSYCFAFLAIYHYSCVSTDWRRNFVCLKIFLQGPSVSSTMVSCWLVTLLAVSFATAQLCLLKCYCLILRSLCISWVLYSLHWGVNIFSQTAVDGHHQLWKVWTIGIRLRSLSSPLSLYSV